MICTVLGGSLGLPHARGGVSNLLSRADSTCESSPRPWGCFFHVVPGIRKKLVFPTPVGVFLIFFHAPIPHASLPHARGGVSLFFRYLPKGIASSPRPWGCFDCSDMTTSVYHVFPTPVGVFLNGSAIRIQMSRLPHARGGVSTSPSAPADRIPSSPRPWGCFRQPSCRRDRYRVFPTPVGVFLFPGRCPGGGYGLPHARGGVSGSFVLCLFQN